MHLSNLKRNYLAPVAPNTVVETSAPASVNPDTFEQAGAQRPAGTAQAPTVGLGLPNVPEKRRWRGNSDPTMYPITMMLGRKETREALKIIDAQLETFPDDSWALYLKARACFIDGDMQGCVYYARQVHAGPPLNHYAYDLERIASPGAV